MGCVLRTGVGMGKNTRTASRWAVQSGAGVSREHSGSGGDRRAFNSVTIPANFSVYPVITPRSPCLWTDQVGIYPSIDENSNDRHDRLSSRDTAVHNGFFGAEGWSATKLTPMTDRLARVRA